MRRYTPWVDRQYVRSVTRALTDDFGMDPVDSLAAALIGNCILALDEACLPDAPRVLVEYQVQRHVHIIARCHHEWPKRRERYEIRVPNLAERIKGECRRLGYITADGEEDMPMMLVGIAGHEVRHRVQRRLGVRLFTPFCKAGPSFTLRALVSSVSEDYRAKQAVCSKTVKGKALASVLYNDEELDAAIVERFVSQLGLYRTSVEEMAKLVLAEPVP